jgi:hypothetical protein
MARPRALRQWGLAIFLVCLAALAGGQPGETATAVRQQAVPATASLVSVASDVAILPARVDESVRAARSTAAPRLLLLAAVVAALFGLPAQLRRTSPAVVAGRAPARARRHAIALRAPPTRFA